MKSIARRVLSCFLAVLMLVSLFPEMALAADEGFTTTVSSVNTVIGTSFDVNVTLENNPGISAYKLLLQYDTSLLTLEKVTYNTEMGGSSVAPQKLDSPVTLFWYSGLTDVNYNGTFATLTFKVSDTLTDDEVTTISASFDAEDITNTNQDSVPMTAKNGTISIFLVRPGDINGDAKTNNKDLVCLAQYLANWEVSVSASALDTNGDGKTNNKDLVLLAQYLANWEVEIFPKVAPVACKHSALSHVEEKAATCVATGNSEHWVCTKCGKLFSDAAASVEITKDSTVLPIDPHNHAHIEVIPAKAPTYTETGNKEGWRCLDCGAYEMEIIPILEPETYSISYNEAGTDVYLATLNLSAQNNNRREYKAGDKFSLSEMSVPGYIFEGWYDGQGASANRVTRITEDMSGDITLYAHWTAINYTINFSSNLYPISSISYKVNTGAVLPNPSLSNYVFVGWTDENGELLTKASLPVGTIGNRTLTANWTSERYKTVTYNDLADPIIYEDLDNDVLYFAYEIGEIQNVPLYTVKDFGYINGDGITKTETTTYKMQVSESLAQAYSEAVADSTTRSSNWTLSSGWSDSANVDKEWCDEHGISEAEATSRGTTETGNWNVSNSKGGSYTSTKLTTGQTNRSNEVKLSSSDSSTHGSKLAAGASIEAGMKGFGFEGKVSAEVSGEESNSTTQTSGMAVGGTLGSTTIKTSSAASTSSWNNTSSYGGSTAVSSSDTRSYSITDKISEKTKYGSSYVQNGSSSENTGLSRSQTSSEEYSTTTSYSKIEEEAVTRTWTTQGTKPGYHRWVVAGTMHVFAIVGYDMTTKSYFVNTHSMMDDYTYEFEDYSYTSPNYDDNQNGVISFEVPYFVSEYVENKTCYSEGLKINVDTGIIEAYTGTDNGVVIPDYMPVYSHTDAAGVKHYDIVEVKGISANAFANNADIAVVSLPESITEIPAGAFQNCTSLFGVLGGTITRIGDNAFNGCTSIVCAAVHSGVTYLGSNAFSGAQRLLVNAGDADILQAAAASGAKNIVLYTNHMVAGEDSLSEKTLNIPEGTESLELNGFGQTFHNLKILSGAAKTVLNKMDLESSIGAPLQLSSTDVVLNQVTVGSNNLCLVLTADNVNLGLQGSVNLNSGTQATVVSRDASLYESSSNATGTMTLSGDMLVCGDVSAQQLLARSGAEIRKITEEEFSLYVDGVIMVLFDENGGDELAQGSTEAFRNQPVGELPIPTRAYYEFGGWYTEPEGGILITEASSLTEDTTLYAHWIAKTYNVIFNSNGGSAVFDPITAFCDLEIGELPTPTRALYTFDGWYTDPVGGELITASTVRSVAEDLVLYAHWTANQHTVTFAGNMAGASVSETSRVVTCDSPIGELPTASCDYYYFDGWFTEPTGGTKYTASTVIVTDADFTLYAHWTANDMHDWTLASEVPADAQIVDEKWTYTLTSSTESTEASLPGWTQVGSYWNQTGTGSTNYATFPSGFDTSHKIYKNFAKSAYTAYDNGSTKREVTNTSAGYVYYHWMYNVAYANTTKRTISSKKLSKGVNDTRAYIYFYAFTSSKDCPYLSKDYCNNQNVKSYNCHSVLPETSSIGIGTPRFCRFSYYKSTYTDYVKVYMYQSYADLESSTAVTPSDTISNVQHWVRYRDRTSGNAEEGSLESEVLNPETWDPVDGVDTDGQGTVTYEDGQDEGTISLGSDVEEGSEPIAQEQP